VRLVFVSHSFSSPDRLLDNIGGMQRVAMDLDAAIRGLGESDLEYQSIVLEASWKWVHLLAVPFLVTTYFKLARQIRRNEVDVILFSSMVTASLAVLLKGSLRRHNVRATAIVHGQDVTKPVAAYQKLVPQIFAALDLVMPVSAATGEACVERGLPPEKLAVVHNGVKLDRFVRCEAPAGGRASHPFRQYLGPDTLLLASVGRQVERKGFAWFIEHVMPRLPDHVHYWLGGDGPEAEAIQRALQGQNLQHRVRLLGRLGDAELTELYQSADLFVMPNIPIPGDMEGFGIVMLEAAMNGLPTVAARLEGIREVITEGENGYFVESGDVDGYVSRVLELDGDRPGLSRLSTTSTHHVSTTFGWDAVASNYITALKRVHAN
jgi:phosphatidylinositol alpha-1,6-mannosyltransferase